jgi:hypothetical protein
LRWSVLNLAGTTGAFQYWVGMTLMCFELSLTFSKAFTSVERDFQELLDKISIPGMSWSFASNGDASGGRSWLLLLSQPNIL